MNHQMINIKFLFFCRASSKNKKGLSPIVLRVTFQHEIADIFTGLHCDPQDWNKNAQRVYRKAKTTSVINENLYEIWHKCMEKFDEMRYVGRPFILDEFVMNIKGKEKRPETILEYLSKKTEDLKGRVGIDITKATLQKYVRCISHVKEFLNQKNKVRDIAVASITTPLLKDFFYFLRSEKHNSHNTSVNYLKCLKTVLMPAIKYGQMKHDPFYDLRIAPIVTNRGFLSVEEINQLEELKDLPPGISKALHVAANAQL